jgi:GGDEF domain-containing protein
MGGLILERARAYGGAEAFVGHVGGDDFVIVVSPSEAEELAQDLVEAFDSRMPRWYTGDTGPEQMAKRMSLSIAIVDAQKAQAVTADDLAKLLAQAKRASKKREGSNFVVWKPEPPH